ncbi:MAG TPA: glycine--tRNA ligase subunit beta, partial [Polymorphobacter sp.]|nr:glycine--tRNA ligase subunit beta [Polymorphobacter sp.]
ADKIEVFATPRRLALIATGLPDHGAAVSEERRGPRADAPAQALEGFLRSTGMTRDQLEERETPKGVFLYAHLRSEGRPTAELLAELIPQIIRDFDWPKSMRWGPASGVSSSPRWVRPLTGIIALLGDHVVPLEIAGITSGRTTRGHRFMSHGAIEIAHPRFYAANLRDAHVILDPAERRDIILTRARKLAADAGLTLIEDDGLATENAGLTEWPVPLLGKFDPAFLDVPPEVIQLTMRTNQKYFACADASGKLAPVFIAVANIEANDGGAAIAAGNARVLSARLSDAKFFWDGDIAKVKAEGLEAFTPKLADIVFHEKLGTVADKVERVAKLARYLAGFIRGCDADHAELAARLCKADLTTGTVGEFPEVQGLAGGYLARAAGLTDAVADAIRDHYKPVGQGDDVPTAPVSVAVALADKLDTLTNFFKIGQYPTGSKDPFALRR